MSSFWIWVTHAGLELVIVASATFLAVRAVNWLYVKLAGRLASVADSYIWRQPERAASARSRAAALGAGRYLLCVTLVVAAFVATLTRFGVPASSLAAAATVIGLGLGLGAQRLIGDLLAGAVIIAERTFGVGDWIRVSSGPAVGITGKVVSTTLRVTQLSDDNGDMVTISNADLRHVTNLSRQWGAVTVDVPLPDGVSSGDMIAALDAAAVEIAADRRWCDVITRAPHVTGARADGARHVLQWSTRCAAGWRDRLTGHMGLVALGCIEQLTAAAEDATVEVPGDTSGAEGVAS